MVTKEVIWKHATSMSQKELIRKEGFNLKNCQGGMWGKGVYFSNSSDDALKYGSKVIEASVFDDCVVYFKYENLAAIIPDLLIEEEAGDPVLKEIVTQELNKQAVSISYSDGVTHLVVYDPNCIQIIN